MTSHQTFTNLFVLSAILLLLLLSSTSTTTIFIISATNIDPSYGSSHQGNASITSIFSSVSDSSSLRVGASFEYVGVVIYHTTSSYFNIDTFKQQVINSLPDTIKMTPSAKKQYEDNFQVLDFCTWSGLNCGSMVSHDWESFISRASMESTVSICLDTLERSRTGDFAILPFINDTSGAKLENGQQTLVRFTFNGANTKAAMTQLNGQTMGACRLSTPEVEVGAPGLYAYSGSVMSSHLDFPVRPMSISLPNDIQRELDKIKKAIIQNPVNSSALGILFFLVVLFAVGFLLYKLWKNKQRREAFRQKQKTQEIPEELKQRREMRANANDDDPYRKEETRARGRNANDSDDDEEMKENNNNKKEAPMDDDEMALEAAIAAARSHFKKASDNVSTFLGLPRDGDRPVFKEGPDYEVDTGASHPEDRRNQHQDVNVSASTATNGDDDGEENNGQDDDEVPRSVSPPEKRQDTDIFA